MIEKFYVNVSGGQIHGRRVTKQGVPIILLHRTPVSSSGFEEVMVFLQGEGQTAIALDTPGFGESFRPIGEPSARQYGKWLLEAVNALGIESFHLAAHHTGTHFALEMAALHPERIASLTLSGVILATQEERNKMRADIGLAPDIDSEGRYINETYKLMKSLFLEPDARLVHAETMGALSAGKSRDQAFNAIFDQDCTALLDDMSEQLGKKLQLVQAMDDPLTLNGMFQKFCDRYPDTRAILVGPAFLATPERQSGGFSRAILNIVRGDQTMTNRQYHLDLKESNYELKSLVADVPAPGKGEVLMRVHAVSINRRDLSVKDLSYPVNGANHFVPLSDGAGEVVSVGPDVTAWKPGDRVASTFFQNYSGGRLTLPAAMSSLGNGGNGMFADYVILPDSGLVPIPDNWSYSEAASLTCAGVTAWSALKTLGGLKEGDDVLIIGTGGVALFAIQIAANSGANAIVLSSSAEKIEKAKVLGATAGFNYLDLPDWSQAVREHTSGAGVQHVVELGGAGTLRNSVASLGLNGHLALIGALDGFGGTIDTQPMIFSALRASAVMVGSRADHLALTEFMVEHNLRPVIEQEYGFDQANEAYQHAGRGAFGKIVIDLGS